MSLHRSCPRVSGIQIAKLATATPTTETKKKTGQNKNIFFAQGRNKR